MPLFAIKAREPLGDRQCADTKSTKITKKREEGVFVRKLSSGQKDELADKNPSSLFPSFVLFVFFVSLCEILRYHLPLTKH
jgi:hypothetical protein